MPTSRRFSRYPCYLSVAGEVGWTLAASTTGTESRKPRGHSAYRRQHFFRVDCAAMSDDEYDNDGFDAPAMKGGEAIATPQELQSKIDNLRAELRRMKEGDVIAKERDKLRLKLRDISEEHKREVDEIRKAQCDYQETKRLVEVQQDLTTTRKHYDEIKQAYSDLVQDCNEARSFLLQDLLKDFEEKLEDKNGASKDWNANPKAQKAKEHITQVKGTHMGFLNEARRTEVSQLEELKESSVSRKARTALKEPKKVDANKYQFIKINELVRLRLEKQEREFLREIDKVKISGAIGGGRISGGGSMGTGLMSATRARLSSAEDAAAVSVNASVTSGALDGEGSQNSSNDMTSNAAAMVSKLEQELDAMGKRNRKLEERCSHLEHELKVALGHADDLIVLKSKALQLLERQKAEKETRLRAEAATKLANRKVLALSQHIEKLMLHLKHEAAAKAKAHEAAGRATQEVSLLRARNAALGRRAAARDQIIVELKEGAKILEDQLRLMDEKYMELRTKLDYTRISTGREVNKYKAQCSQLRAKWALLSNQPGHQPTLLDEMEVPASGELYASAVISGASNGPETLGGSDAGAVINGGKKSKKKGSRPNTTGDGAAQGFPAM